MRFFLLIVLALSGFALADGRKFDPADGSDPRQYPPDPQVDFIHMKLDVQMADPASKSFTCTETLSFKTLGLPIAALKLDAVNLDIQSVKSPDGRPLEFHYDDKHLTVRFQPELPPNAESALVIEYSCTNPAAGLTFALPDEAYRDRPLMVHSQGQAETNRYWFISHDYPNERFTSEIAATVPGKYSVLSNGGLVEKKSLDHGMVRWHYRLGKPHVSYLVSIVIGEFEVVSDKWRDISVEYWVPPGQQSGAIRTFGKTPKMMDLFSRLTGTDYPYEKYAQAVVYLFNSGGMENTSTTTLHEMSVMDERAALDQDMEGLISHELAHQWFGDMITCKSWAHIWLNEGFATYFSHLWDEYERGRQEYDDELWHTMQSVADASAPDSSGGMVWFYYDDAWETFRRGGNNAYTKGASILHMLRQALGDELFFKCIAEYVKRNAWKQAETDDLRVVIEELSGRSFERFFQQWVYRSGAPRVQATYAWDAVNRQASITLRQKQEVTADCPLFVADVDVWLVDGRGTATRRSMKLHGRTATASFACDAEPAQVVIDPHSAVLMKLELEIPQKMLIAQATAGPTTIARLSAIAALARHDRAPVRAALREILLNDTGYFGLRNEAAVSLGKMQTNAARDLLLEALNDPAMARQHKVRRAAVAALGSYRDDKAAEALIRFATSDPSYAVEAEACKALGKQAPSERVIDVLIACSSKPSWRDQVRTSAVESLGNLTDPRGIEPAMALAAYGQPYRSRGSGIDALGKLGRENEQSRDAVRAALIKLLDDPQQRPAMAVIAALDTLGDDEAIPDLQKVADGSARPDRRERARQAVESIRKQEGESGTIRQLRERIETLEKKAREPATVPAN